MRRSSHHLIKYYIELFNEPINMQAFENRLLLQKRVFFLQEFGIPFGYSFGWYIRGPYSSELARDGFENEPISKLCAEKWDTYSKLLPKSEDADRKNLEKAKAFFDCVRGSEIPEDRFLELSSSLHFLKITWFPNDEDYSKAAKRLKELKPRFKEEEIEEARELLQRFQ